MSENDHPTIMDDIPPFSPVCVYCAHLEQNGAERSCRAFPAKKSIPMTIWMGQNPHTSPVDGDHGITFALHPDAKRES